MVSSCYFFSPYLIHCNCIQCKFKYKPVSYHFPCFADGLVLVYVSIFGGLLLFDFIHHSVDGKAEAGHARQVADGDVKLQRAVLPRVV